jgi:16S rRNA (guanine527-N7)-methyltransferase
MILGNEDQARAWVADLPGVSRETMGRLDALAAFVADEARHQNLVSETTLALMWQRHIADSAQLLRFAEPLPDEHWVDLGSGAGFPGLVVALLSPCRMTLVESRALRIAYLDKAIDRFGLRGRVEVAGRALEKVESFAADYVSARAFAPLPRLLEGAGRFSTEKTRWLLPKGRNARAELESIAAPWQKLFHVEQSLTDAEAAILVGTGRVAPLEARKAPHRKAIRRHRSKT